MEQTKTSNSSGPVFVVGHPRSGTTLVATLIGRHPNISMPPETQFFPEIYDEQMVSGPELAKRALENPRVRDLGLSEERFISSFNATSMSFRDLFELIIRSYCEKVGKCRPGEKSPNHLKWAETLLDWFPNAKIVIVMRDGRDVANSLMNVPWSHDNIIKHSVDWVTSQDKAEKLLQVAPNSTHLIRYENLLTTPDIVLKKLCGFLGETYDPVMLKPGASDAVPNWEADWKEKARLDVDPSNVGKWKDRRYIERAVMNTLMGSQLERNGYLVDAPNIFVRGCVRAVTWPYLPKVRPLLSRIKSAVICEVR